MQRLEVVEWPSGISKGLMVLGESGIALSERLGIEFDRLDDQLGPLWAVGMRLESGAIVELTWRPDLTQDGVAISVDENQVSRAVLGEVVAMLGLTPEDSVSWLSPDVIWWVDEVGK